jgi:hypothetical protein
LDSCYVSWNYVVTDFLGTKLNYSNNDVDRRSTLQVCMGAAQPSPTVWMDRPSAVICLKRSDEPHAVEDKVTVEHQDTRRPVKKRKIVLDSGDLNGMIGG